MTSHETRHAFHSTSAAGAMMRRRVRAPVVGHLLAGLGTSTTSALLRDGTLPAQRSMEQTTAGAAVVAAEPAGAAIAELRRLSGFTWDQLARVFNVSRRALHFWASGKPMAPSNEEHLQRLISVVRKIDRGSASANRAALLGVREDGRLPLDLLAAGDYERVLSLLGLGEARRISPPSPSDEARAAQAPRSPEELVGALQDRIHREAGTARAAKSVRVRSDR